MIAKVGASAPDWWDSVPLKYPDRLDLDWPLNPGGDWNNQKNVGQYIWDVINPNPGRWKEGIKLVHHLMLRNKGDRAKLARSMECLGIMFHNFTQDWLRAAFWWRMSMKYGQPIDQVELANCFWRMSCEEMAREILEQFTNDYTRNGAIIKLWADMGKLDKALSLAEQKARSGNPNIAYLAAGNACRQAGRMAEALVHYRKAADAEPPDKNSGDFNRARVQAAENIAVIRTFDLLDLKRTANGRYRAQAPRSTGR
jgi:tetratricopeptide (TPR) repeat protein